MQQVGTIKNNSIILYHSLEAYDIKRNKISTTFFFNIPLSLYVGIMFMLILVCTFQYGFFNNNSKYTYLVYYERFFLKIPMGFNFKCTNLLFYDDDIHCTRDYSTIIQDKS